MVTGRQLEPSPMTSMQTTGHRDLVNCLRYGSRKVCLVQVDVRIPCDLASFLGSTRSCLVHLHVHLAGNEFKGFQITCNPRCDCNIMYIDMEIMWCGC